MSSNSSEGEGQVGTDATPWQRTKAESRKINTLETILAAATETSNVEDVWVTLEGNAAGPEKS